MSSAMDGAFVTKLSTCSEIGVPTNSKKPVTAATKGKVNMDAHVLAGVVMTGAVGKTTAYIVLSWQAESVLIEFAGVEPHADCSLYLAFIVQHPFVLFSKLFAVANVP